MSDIEILESGEPKFEGFESIARLSRNCLITEKIDGTNAQVCVLEDGRVYAGSRTRWVTPEKDNMGWAAWVKEHEEELRTGLGIGRHFGEWWGVGIGRRYGLSDKRFSLFNATRWTDDVRPGCCGVVPIMYEGIFTTTVVDEQLERLRMQGSLAAPGFMDPEGVVIYVAAARKLFKKTLKGDEHKGPADQSPV